MLDFVAPFTLVLSIDNPFAYQEKNTKYINKAHLFLVTLGKILINI